MPLSRAEHSRLYRQRHPEKIRERKRREYARNRAGVRAHQTEADGATPEVFLRRLAGVSGRDHPVAADYLIAMWHAQGGRCYWSGVAMSHARGRGRVPTNASIDRVDPSKGYTPGNMVLCCWFVNKMKSNASPEVFLGWCKAVVSQEAVCRSIHMSA